jgi:2-oxo-4-hydroxy-4-carboxy-5-ureidoimidazoline decarboxylase
MCAAFSAAMRAAPEAAQYALVRAHPELGHRLGVDPGLTADSAQEQGGAGLDRLTPEEYTHFRALNDAYTHKFGMPFVICVRKVGGHAKQVIAQAMEQRLASTPQAELAEALSQIDAIAALRLHDKVVA